LGEEIVLVGSIISKKTAYIYLRGEGVNGEVIKLLSPRIRCILQKGKVDYDSLIELRLRVNEPVIVAFLWGEQMLHSDCGFTTDVNNTYRVEERDIRATIDMVSNYSLYAYEEELKNGFITVKGGHRVGLAGQVVLEQGKVKSVKNISFINIRVSHEIKGCSREVLPYIISEERPIHTLIVSPPGCGKTTLLRDIVRCLSDGNPFCKGMNVGLVDERSEIGACYMGVPQNDLGIRCDVLDGCPKAEGMIMLLRSMNPRVIAVDEIGTREDIDAIEYIINSGCSILATVHGGSIDDIRNKPQLRRLIENRMFDRYIVLSRKQGIGTVENIFDERGNDLYKASLSIAN